MLIEIHMIQNHSPANMNRDDLGAPKTCLFGGVARARISSQCLKRSIRNPGNPDDVHNRGAGIFHQAMAAHIGCRTKFFPWLVERELPKSEIPEEEHKRVVLAAQRISASKEKEEKKAGTSAKSDPRPRTPQLIHLGPGHAKLFVEKLQELRRSHRDQYDYFLNPVAGFQEIVEKLLSDSDLSEELQKKIVKVSWVVAKCRMNDFTEGENAEPKPEMEDGQPGIEYAKFIVKRLDEIHSSDENRYKELTKPPTKDEKSQIKEDAPAKPKGMNDFMDALKSADRLDAVDIALFGRMTTSDAFQDVEAAMQAAHAISTHAVVNETDYCTAVDDLGKTGGGAGHVFEAMYNSACFYKYFSLDWDQLVFNLAGPEPEKNTEVHKRWIGELKPNARKLAAAALGHFIRAAALTTPSGKQNSCAAHNPLDGILVEIKKNGKTPLSYANAFAEPARKIGDPPDDAADAVSLVGRSIAQFGDYVYRTRRALGIDSILLWHSPTLWRYPLQGWEREPDGGKKKENNKEKPPVPLTDNCFDLLVGRDGTPGLVEAVIKELGLEWAGVKNLGKEGQP